MHRMSTEYTHSCICSCGNQQKSETLSSLAAAATAAPLHHLACHFHHRHNLVLELVYLLILRQQRARAREKTQLERIVQRQHTRLVVNVNAQPYTHLRTTFAHESIVCICIVYLHIVIHVCHSNPTNSSIWVRNVEEDASPAVCFVYRVSCM